MVIANHLYCWQLLNGADQSPETSRNKPIILTNLFKLWSKNLIDNSFNLMSFIEFSRFKLRTMRWYWLETNFTHSLFFLSSFCLLNCVTWARVHRCLMGDDVCDLFVSSADLITLTRCCLWMRKSRSTCVTHTKTHSTCRSSSSLSSLFAHLIAFSRDRSYIRKVNGKTHT